MSSMALPYVEPLVPREPGERQIPEPPRRGEPGGPPCAICNGKTTAPVWSDLEAAGMALPVWEDVLPNVTDEELAAAAERVAQLM